MKRISKVLSIGLSAITLLSGSTAIASAAVVPFCPQPQVKVISCDGKDCDNAQSILQKLKSCKGSEAAPCDNKGCDSTQSVLQTLKNCKSCETASCDNKGCDSTQSVLQTLKNCKSCETAPCDNKGCDNTQSVLQTLKYCKSCDWNELLKCLNGDCSGSKCTNNKCTKVPEVPAEQPTEDPAEAPAKPEQPAAPAQSESSEFNTAYEAEVLRLINAERAKYGLAALSMDAGATDAAHIRAKEIVKSFSHTRPDGSSCFTAAKEVGLTYRTAGENIAYGYATPQQVVNGWMNSEGHRRNILSPSFTKIGIGCYRSGGTLYWSQFFIG